MRIKNLTIAISLAIAPAMVLADNSNLSNAMATNPELGSYQSSSLNPASLPEYGAKDTSVKMNNVVIDQTVDQVFANVGDGLAVGTQAGLTSGQENTNFNVPEKDIKTYSLPGASVGIHVGYGNTFTNQFYLGTEAYANLSNSTFAPANSAGVVSAKSIIGHNIGFAILPGYQISPSSLFYTKLGLNLAQITTTPLNNPSQSTYSTWTPGVDFGIGYRQALSSNLSLALEYDWIAYNAKIRQVQTYATTSRFIQNLFQLSLNYQFDSMDPSATGSRPALSLDSPYVGITAGRKVETMNIVLNNGSSTYDDPWTGNGWTEKVKLGYGHQFNSWFYLGGEIFAEANQNIAPQSLGASLSREGNSFGFSLLPGYIINQSNLFYGRFGVIHTKFSNDFNIGSASQFNVNKLGYQLGLGYETALTQCLSLIAEYDYTLYSAFHNYVSASKNFSYKPTDQLFSLGLNYRF